MHTNRINSTSGQRSYANFAKAAEDSDDSVAPRSTGGGEIATATGTWAPSGTAEATGTSTETSASSTESSDANAGLEARGEIRWGLMTAGMAMAGLFGGLMM
jgi:hypothetical protein